MQGGWFDRLELRLPVTDKIPAGATQRTALVGAVTTGTRLGTLRRPRRQKSGSRRRCILQKPRGRHLRSIQNHQALEMH